MKQKLMKLESLLKNLKNPIIDILDPPITKHDIIESLEKIKMQANREIIDLYTWRGGVDVARFFSNEYKSELFSNGVYLSLVGATSMYLLDKSTVNLFDNRFFPLFFSSTGDKILIDLKITSGTYGSLFIFAPAITLSSEPIRIYDSLESWIETVITCYESEVYTINHSGQLEINFEREEIVSRALNKNSEFWIS